MPAEWKQALRIVWLVVSAATLAVLAASLPAAAPLLSRVLPVCEARARGQSGCPLCGMTSAFQAISRGEWREAPQANRGALPLYSLLLLNQTAAGAWVLARARRRRHGGVPCRS